MDTAALAGPSKALGIEILPRHKTRNRSLQTQAGNVMRRILQNHGAGHLTSACVRLLNLRATKPNCEQRQSGRSTTLYWRGAIGPVGGWGFLKPSTGST